MAEKFSGIREGVRNSAVIKNPVLFEAIGIAPVVAMAVSLKTAIMLSVISTAELVIIESFSCLFLKKIKQSFRVLIYAVLGVLINIPLFMFFNRFAPNETANVSIFLPVIAVNSLIALHCERVAVKNDFKTTLVDAVSASVGYVFIIVLLGTIREVLGSGTFYSFDLKLPVKFSGLLLPFGGFLLLGFLAAFFKKAIKKKYPDEQPEAAFNLSEISEKPFDSIKSIVKEDFNPFADFFESAENTVSDIQSVAGETAEAPESTQKKKKPLFAGRKADKSDKKDKKEKNNEPAQLGTDEVPSVTERQRSRVYESEFDDLLAELEKSKAAVSEREEEQETDSGFASENKTEEADGE